MNCRTQVVLAAGIGYLLGRQHKLRWGLMLAAAAATGRLSRPGGVLQHGVRALGSSEELQKLGQMGGPLVAATKDAAKAAVTGRLGSVTDRLRERTDTLREPRDEDRDREEPRRREPRDEDRPRRREPRAEDEEYEERDDYDEAEEEEQEPVMAGARSRSRPPVRRRGTSR